MFGAISNQAQQKFPGQIFTGSEDMMRVLCLPVPSFSIRYLLQQEGWPLSRFVMLVGEEESCKTSLAAEIIRWHSLIPGGGGVYIPTEPKESLELIYSIIGYDHKHFRTHAYCKTTQEWNAAGTWWINTFRTYMDGRKRNAQQAAIKPHGRSAPVALVIDSIMANVAKSTAAKIEQDGAPSRHFAENALVLDDWFKYICPELRGYPITLLGINHLKPHEVKTGIITRTERNIGGGKTPKFLCSLQIQMDRKSSIAPGQGVNRVKQGDTGIRLAISVWKNSLAPHERIEVEMLWYTDYDDRDPAGHFRQKTYFDWHSASTETLIGLIRAGGKKAKRIWDILDVHPMDHRQVWSQKLGITAKRSVSYRDFGALLEAKLAVDGEFRNALYAECGIRRRYLFQPGMDFREQEKIAVALARQVDNGWKQQAQTIVGNADDVNELDKAIVGDADDDPDVAPEADDPTIVGDDRRQRTYSDETIVEDVDDGDVDMCEEPWDGEEALRIVPTQPPSENADDNGQETLI
jgi:hypothetical protein